MSYDDKSNPILCPHTGHAHLTRRSLESRHSAGPKNRLRDLARRCEGDRDAERNIG